MYPSLTFGRTANASVESWILIPASLRLIPRHEYGWRALLSFAIYRDSVYPATNRTDVLHLRSRKRELSKTPIARNRRRLISRDSTRRWKLSRFTFSLGRNEFFVSSRTFSTTKYKLICKVVDDSNWHENKCFV